MVLARRGFQAVHLADRENAIGGRLRWTRRLPTLGDWGRITDWRVTQLNQLPNVEVITGRELSTDDVLDYGADIVIIATGSLWADDGSQPDTDELITGVADALTPEQIMEGARPNGHRVVVYDCDGYYVAPGIAELLALEGFDVQLVTTHPVISPMSDGSLEGTMLRQHLHDVGVTMRTGTTITARSGGTITARTEFGEQITLAADDLVLVTHQAPVDGLYRELISDPDRLAAQGISAVYLIGDAAAPRWISEAVFDGHRLAREIDLPTPAFPAPMLREPLS